MADGRETVHLEVQESADQWQDLGRVQLLVNHGNNANNGHDQINTPSSHRNQLPLSVKMKMVKAGQQRKGCYLYRHAPNQSPNTNLLILLHGSGDTHRPFHQLAKTMRLPQTATLAISARDFAVLPFDLGHTWFHEIDYSTGDALPEEHPIRKQSLQAAVDRIKDILEELLFKEEWTIPERIFFLGYGSGASVTMELCASWKRQPLGGAVCVSGGSTMNTDRCLTPVLLMVGDRDPSFPVERASRLQTAYGKEAELHIEPNKGQGMISSQSEMRRVMKFYAQRLVRQSSF